MTVDQSETLPPPDQAIVTRPVRFRRRRKIIQPGLQFKVAVIFAFVLISTLTFFAARLNVVVANQGGAHGTRGGTTFGELLRSELLVAVAIGVILTMSVAIAVTFRIAGPVYRMSQFLKGVRDGTETAPCRLRKGDSFGDLCTLLNEVTVDQRLQNETEPGQSAIRGSTAEPAPVSMTAPS